MELTYEESGLVAKDGSVDASAEAFTNKMAQLFKKEDTFFKKTSLKRAHTLTYLSNVIDITIYKIQECLNDDDILFSVEHYANYYSTLAYILSLNVSLLEWNHYMLAFLFKCDERGVTHRDVAIKTYVTRYQKNLRLLGNKRMDADIFAQMLLFCETDLTAKERISQSLLTIFVNISDKFLNIKY